MAKKTSAQAKASAVLALANKNLADAQKAVATATKRLLKQTHIAEAQARISLEKALNKAAFKAETKKALALKKMKKSAAKGPAKSSVQAAVVVPTTATPQEPAAVATETIAVNAITVVSLRAEAKELGVTGYARMTKAALIDAITAAR